jgi:ubiquinone/menaquinone biosynthesis C-methylase UbiE
MAIQYFGIHRGQQSLDVATGTATTGRAIELAVNDALGITRKDVLDSLDKLRDAITNQRSTPFAQ